ncbi:DUF4192 domain-containing protein [Blastococcus goldschmidtiae]|uniref:DUF4192 domain-containing protein n=1 Tax=Blastococcus goldschmidtiae TaxID=3075546 RepID=A0ABU2KD53_9ACTN|nr:DUF4192 domain-containing protein [Blastococcus sp. DSM 46792]MDT0278097.1 DUF4192 domain-containing protein [Blastococcus sp. DSM 46792]
MEFRDPAPFPAPASSDGPLDDAVLIGDPGELAAGLPQLLGYRPHESIVLVSLGGGTGRRVGLTVRADLPPADHARQLMAVLARSLTTDAPRAALAFVVSEAPDETVPLLPPGVGPGGGWGTDLPHRSLVHDLVLALDAVGLPLEQALLVRGERWWDFDCPGGCCAPGAGTSLPTGVGELAAVAVAAGTVVAADRAELARRLAPPGESSRAAMEAAVLRTAPRSAGGPREVATGRRRIRSVVARCRPGPGQQPPGDAEVARIAWSLREPDVRDWALLLSLGDDAAAAEALWIECTRRAPSPLDAFPAALVAVCAWLRGDGALANIALDRALDSEPGNSLARLVEDALAACVPPRQLRALLIEAGRSAGVAGPPGASAR